MDFETIIERISPTLKNITYKLNRQCTFYDDDDLFQESLLHLWLEYQEGKIQDKTDSYILQNCYYHLKNYIRKSGTELKDRQTVSLDALIDEEDTDSVLADILALKNNDTADILDVLNNKLIVQKILKNAITLREKKILSFYAKGFTTREIGKELGISHVMVGKLMGKIRVKCGNIAKGK